MPSAISRDSSSMRTPWNRKKASTSSPTGVRMRWVNSWPVTGTMLKVGFSARAPRLSDSTSVPAPSKIDRRCRPSLEVEGRGDARGDGEVRRPVGAQAGHVEQQNLLVERAHRLVVAEHGVAERRRPDAPAEAAKTNARRNGMRNRTLSPLPGPGEANHRSPPFCSPRCRQSRAPGRWRRTRSPAARAPGVATARIGMGGS